MESVPKIVRDRLQAAARAATHPDADLLTAFAEQSLPADERATVLEHLARCGECRDVVGLALPPTEILETSARASRSAWLTWPVLRWGFVAAGVVIVASIGFLQLQRPSESSKIAVFSSPTAQVAARSEARPQLTAAPPSAPDAKHDADAATSDRIDEVSKATGVAGEGETAAPAAPPPSALVRSFRGTTRSTFGRSIGGPILPSQFQNNNIVQQQASNGVPAPALHEPADQLYSAKQSPAANQAVAGAPAPIADTEGARLEAQLRDQSSDSRLFADKSSVSKTKLPVTQKTAPGQIAGHVVDSSGAVVPNARITVTPATAGKSASAVTDSQGAFLIAGLPTGNYKAQAQAPGFNTTVLDLNYDASRPSSYNFMLNVGSVAETVEVSAQNAQLQTETETATMGGPVTNGMVSRVPTNGRNSTVLASVSPGQLPRWTVSAGGALQRSFDQGKSWQTVDVNASPMSSASLEVVAGESRAKDVTKENVADKKLRKQEVASPVFRAVAAAGSEVWVGGSGGALYHSLDAGNHWTHVVPASGGTALAGDVISLEFPDSQNGKVTTSTPEVWTTSDAGQTWQKQ